MQQIYLLTRDITICTWRKNYPFPPQITASHLYCLSASWSSITHFILTANDGKVLASSQKAKKLCSNRTLFHTTLYKVVGSFQFVLFYFGFKNFLFSEPTSVSVVTGYLCRIKTVCKDKSKHMLVVTFFKSQNFPIILHHGKKD